LRIFRPALKERSRESIPVARLNSVAALDRIELARIAGSVMKRNDAATAADIEISTRLQGE
jgi:hypothetical protein